MFRYRAILILAITLQVSHDAVAQPSIDHIQFKGTHNSYSDSGDLPAMQDPPWIQMDDYGTWVLELDFSIKETNGQPVARVGHDSPGHWCGPWVSNPHLLQEYLQQIAATSAASRRPTFLILDKKNWGEAQYSNPTFWVPAVEDLLEATIGADRFFRIDDFINAGQQWPTLQQLGNKFIVLSTRWEAEGTLIAPVSWGHKKLIFVMDDLSDLDFGEYPANEGAVQPGHRTHVLSYPFKHEDHDIEKLASNQGADWSWRRSLLDHNQHRYLGRLWDDHFLGALFIPSGDCTEISGLPWFILAQDLGFSLLCCDQYGACEDESWTWEVVAPPNPIVVAHGGGDAPDGQRHGTWAFPYNSIQIGVNKASPGWTVLISSGSYHESLTVDKELTLSADGGTVTIGQ